MNVQRYNDSEWRVMAVTLLRDATRKQDWRAVEAAMALLELRETPSYALMRKLAHRYHKQHIEQAFTEMEQGFDAWMVEESRVIGRRPLAHDVNEAWEEACLYECTPNWGVLLTQLRPWKYLDDYTEGYDTVSAINNVCREMLIDRILKRERKHNPALLRA